MSHGTKESCASLVIHQPLFITTSCERCTYQKQKFRNNYNIESITESRLNRIIGYIILLVININTNRDSHITIKLKCHPQLIEDTSQMV